MHALWLELSSSTTPADLVEGEMDGFINARMNEIGLADYSVKPKDRRAVEDPMRVALRTGNHIVLPDVVNVLRTQLGTTHFPKSLSVYSTVQCRHEYISLLQ